MLLATAAHHLLHESGCLCHVDSVQELPEEAEVWKAASADMSDVPIVPVLGWFESAPVEEWRRNTDPLDSIDSFWLVCKFEGAQGGASSGRQSV